MCSIEKWNVDLVPPVVYMKLFPDLQGQRNSGEWNAATITHCGVIRGTIVDWLPATQILRWEKKSQPDSNQRERESTKDQGWAQVLITW